MKRCKICGSELADNIIFCPNCGTNILSDDGKAQKINAELLPNGDGSNKLAESELRVTESGNGSVISAATVKKSKKIKTKSLVFIILAALIIVILGIFLLPRLFWLPMPKGGPTIETASNATAGLCDDGTILYAGESNSGRHLISHYSGAVKIAMGTDYSYVLYPSGNVSCCGGAQMEANQYLPYVPYIFDPGDVSEWKNIVDISAGYYHAVGLKADGTVVSTPFRGDPTDYPYAGATYVSSWKNIVAISAGYFHTVGLKSDGTVVSTKYIYKDDIYNFGQCDVNDWSDIVAVSAGLYHTVGLKKDGTVVAVGNNSNGQCDVNDWSDIVAVSAGLYHTVGLKKDGTVVSTEFRGKPYYGECEVSDWTDIVAISAGASHTVGLKKDGTVVATEYQIQDWNGHIVEYCGQSNVYDWQLITKEENAEFTPLSFKEVRSVLTDLLEKRDYVSQVLFGSGVQRKETDSDVTVYNCRGASRSIVTDPNYQNIDDVRAKVESVYTKATANDLYQTKKYGDGYNEYIYFGGFAKTVFECMYTEEDGKLYFYDSFYKPYSISYDYDGMNIEEQTANTIKLSIDIVFTESFDTEKADITLKKENGKWLIEEYDGVY